MYTDNSTRKILICQRPQVDKVTASRPRVHHALEDILSQPSVRKAQLKIIKTDSAGKCFLQRLRENFDNPHLDR